MNTTTTAADKLHHFISTLTESQLIDAIQGVTGVPLMGGTHADLVLELEARFPATANAAWEAIMADESDTMSFADALTAVMA